MWPLEWETVEPARAPAARVGRPWNGPTPGTLGALNGTAAPEAPQARKAGPRGQTRWYTISAAAQGGTAVIDIFDEIGYWGTTAADFVAELREVNADEIEVHLNSPGGDVSDGVAIYNALVDHPADVTVVVDALAASIASVIAQAGDRVVMAPHSQMMIHDAWGLQVGNADDMREMADLLDRFSMNIAEVYAQRTGAGKAADWRETMKAEAWYSADEAVEAGLADEALKREARTSRADAKVHALEHCRYAGRAEAPAPPMRPAARTSAPAPIPVGGSGPDDGPSSGPGGGARPGPATGTPDPAPPPAAVEPEDVWADVSDDVFAGLGAALADVADEPFMFDPEAFRAGIEVDANNAPAPPDVPADPISALPDMDTFIKALQEALQ